MRGFRNYCQSESNFDKVLFYLEGEMIQTITTDHHRPASETPFKWRADDGCLVAL